MKKQVFILAILLLCSVGLTAQSTFGIKAGVDLATVKVSGFSDSETGFFVGGFTTLSLSDQFLLQPELLYVDVKDLEFISLPLLAKFAVAENFNLLAGPTFNYFLDVDEDEFKVNLDVGASYDFTEKIDLSARYSLGLGDVKVHGLFIGLGYKF